MFLISFSVPGSPLNSAVAATAIAESTTQCAQEEQKASTDSNQETVDGNDLQQVQKEPLALEVEIEDTQSKIVQDNVTIKDYNSGENAENVIEDEFNQDVTNLRNDVISLVVGKVAEKGLEILLNAIYADYTVIFGEIGVAISAADFVEVATLTVTIVAELSVADVALAGPAAYSFFALQLTSNEVARGCNWRATAT